MPENYKLEAYKTLRMITGSIE